MPDAGQHDLVCPQYVLGPLCDDDIVSAKMPQRLYDARQVARLVVDDSDHSVFLSAISQVCLSRFTSLGRKLRPILKLVHVQFRVELDDALLHALRDRYGADPQFVQSSAQACGVRNAYAQPQRLGVDRFLGMIAAHAQAHEPTVVASCGTALTLDALAADGRHLGGLIAPSPSLMQSALRGNTARLGEPGGAHLVELADNTVDAVESGTWLAGVALIERFVARGAERLGTAPVLILTGGGAAGLAELIKLPHRIDTELVLRGLARFAEQAR